jgi:hypothetical protein
MTASWRFTDGYPHEDVIQVDTDLGPVTVHYVREIEPVTVLPDAMYDDHLDCRDDFWDLGTSDYSLPEVEAARVTVTIIFDHYTKDSLSDYEAGFDLSDYHLSGRRLVFKLVDDILDRNGYERTSFELP